MNVTISLIPIFADRNVSQNKPDFFKILINNDDIIKRQLFPADTSIKEFLSNLYNDYLNIEDEWTEKELANCRKISDGIEITYICKMPYIKNCNKMGQIININDFTLKITDEYYVETIIKTGPSCFK